LTKARRFQSDFSSLAQEYAAYRTSYGADLFDTIASFVGPPSVVPTFMVGQKPPRLRALDLACGTGLGTAGLIAQGFAVTGIDIATEMLAVARETITTDAAFYEGSAESLPFGDCAFELVACGQAFHWFDAVQSFGEIARVLRRGGALALYWKHALPDDPFEACAARLLRELSERDEPFNVSRVYTDHFEEFWKEHAAFRDHEEWRLPLELTFTVESFVGYHSSREIARFHLGERRAEFLDRLHTSIAGLAPNGTFAVRAMQYLYLARKK
jgi:ubiquinone/menaquinone biosynthesis C-methylase UbiE